ncbi:TPA: hypothetical protein N0F65_011277 [Lagenidium giganteum]|uniref:Uncharacterized protein n=1 Tax=Lagenidium giganteum TaxID=4803 RepID=A0AAV2YVG4_9STRA|nr:TPA: hypothetical protein N0F65_011277 [Lagenidium giganteum]
MSCRSVKTEPAAQPRRLKIFYRDEAFREKCASNTRRMLASARNCSNQNLLAMKALKYRKVFDRVKDLDAASLQDPSIDVSKCLGVEWCKV